MRHLAISCPIRHCRAAIVALVMAVAGNAHGYGVNESWCNKDELNAYWTDTWSVRGIWTDTARRDITLAGSWWWDIQSTLGMGLLDEVILGCGPWGNCYKTTLDPGPISAQCLSEVSEFSNGTTYGITLVDTSYHPSCDFFGVNNDEYYIIMRSDLGTPNCSSSGGSGWAYTKSHQLAGKLALMRGVAHEWGHALGLAHTFDRLNAIMYRSTGAGNALRVDDADGVIVGLGEGKRLRSVRTTGATGNSGGPLTFGSANTISSSNSLWMPAISGNKAAAAGSSWGEWAAVWVDANYQMVLAKGTDGSTVGSPVTLSRITTGEFTRSNPGVAVSYPSARIGIAWAGTDQTVNFMSSSDGGSTWAKSTFWGYKAIGGVAVAFSEQNQKWVLLWVSDFNQNSSAADGDSMTIVHRVSDDATGAAWSNPVWVFGNGSTFSMPIRQPAIACRPQWGTCVSGFMSYKWSDKPLMSAGFQMQLDGLQILGEPVDLSSGVQAVSTNPAMTWHEASSGAGYLMTWIGGQDYYGIQPNTMKYAWLAAQSQGGEPTAPFGAVQQWSNGPLVRSGVSVGWNYKKGWFRFLWRED